MNPTNTPTVLSESADLAREIGRHGLSVLQAEGMRGFPDAEHRMIFPRSQGFSGTQEVHCGNVFQRAVMLEVLGQGARAGDTSFESLIQQETQFLLGSRRTSGIGGWAYFRDLVELPPDVDDLAQVILALLAAGRRSEVQRLCELPVRVVLEEGTSVGGGWETWIIPKERDEIQKLQGFWSENAWGAGADVEVVANFCYALLKYDPERFRDAIADGARFVISRQEKDGWWRSTWYHGPYYGTWVCLRLLAAASLAPASVDRGREFLRREQRPDGGWGFEDASDALSTALALLGLRTSVTANDASRADRALIYLNDQRRDDGWPSVPFIRMELGRPTGRPWAVLSYGSRTMTTAYVTKAALDAAP